MVPPDEGIGPAGATAAPLPADLARVVAAWPSLPPAVRAGVLAMIDATAGG